jgi:hypothetical protein
VVPTIIPAEFAVFKGIGMNTDPNTPLKRSCTVSADVSLMAKRAGFCVLYDALADYIEWLGRYGLGDAVVLFCPKTDKECRRR